MAKLQLVKGAADVILPIFIQDSSSTTGAGLTGLVFNSAGLSCYYVRPGSTAAVLTLATQTVTGAHSDGGFVEVDATNMPGWYRLDLSDAIVATGVNSVGVNLKGATNMAPLTLEIQLTNVDLNDSVRGGLTALPNASAEAVGGLFTRGLGTGQINQSANGQIDVNAERLNNVAQSLLDLKDFADAGYDPATNKVEGVKLADITTTNTDMRGTDNAALATGVIVTTNNDKTGYTISGAKTTLDALNDISQAQVKTQADTALTDINLHYVVNTALPISWTVNITPNSALDYMVDNGTAAFDRTTDSLQAIRDRGDVAWLQGSTVDPDNATIAAIASTLGTPAGASVSVDIAAVKSDTVQLISGVIEANTAGTFHAQMLDASGNPVASQAVTIQRKLDNGAYGAATGTASTTDSRGTTLVSYSAADVNGTGAVAFVLSAIGAKDTYLFFKLSI